jgi:hypothetical protein
MANIKEKNQSSTRQGNEYEKLRQLTVQENQKRLQDLGIKNIAKSMTSLAHSQKTKKKSVKQNTYAGDDGEKDYQQVTRSVAPEKVL